MRLLWDNEIDKHELACTLENPAYPIENIQDYQLIKKYRSPAFNNLIDRPDCESETPPMIFDETVPYIPGGPDATFERDIAEAHNDTYSYKVTKTIASGTVATITLCDNINNNDMHGMIAGHTYTKSIWVKVPAASGIALSEVQIRIYDYDGSWENTMSSIPTAFDTWQKLTVTRTIREGATGVHIRIFMPTTVEDTEYFYVDDIRLDDVPQIRIDAGSNNVISVKSFAIGGHNLTGGAKITIEGNDTSDFDSPSYSDELKRNLIINPEDLTTSEWLLYQANTNLTNLYVKNKRLTKIIATADASAYISQLQYPANTTQSFQAIIKKGVTTDSHLTYERNDSPWTIYGRIRITWANQTVTSDSGLTNLNYEWIDDETVWVAGTANAIDISLVYRLHLYVCPTDQLTGKYVYATAMMVEDNPTVTKYEEIHVDLRTHVFSEASYRYWQILIEDFNNPDGYIEVGRIHLGNYLQIDIHSREISIVYEDTSRVDDSPSGQSFGDEGIIRRLYYFIFPYWENDKRKEVVFMVKGVKKVKPIVFVPDENNIDKMDIVYCRLNDDMSINHIIDFSWNGVMAFKEVF